MRDATVSSTPDQKYAESGALETFSVTAMCAGTVVGEDSDLTGLDVEVVTADDGDAHIQSLLRPSQMGRGGDRRI